MKTFLFSIVVIALGAAITVTAQQPREAAPVDLTGTWVSVVTEDWAWRMRTPPKGDFASVPLNAEGTRLANTWTEAQDGSCLAFGAAALLRMPGRLRITWNDDRTLKIESDNGQQTRLLQFTPPSGAPRPRSLQGSSVATWQVGNVARSTTPTWGTLKVVTTNLRAAWIRPNGVPHSENAILTEYFDRYSDGATEWFTVTTIVEDQVYLNEPMIISSNFKREPDGSKWNPRPCKAAP